VSTCLSLCELGLKQKNLASMRGFPLLAGIFLMFWSSLPCRSWDGASRGLRLALSGRRSLFHARLFFNFCDFLGLTRSEVFYAAGGIDEFFFACVERVAVAADFNFNFGLRCADFKMVAAGARYLRFFVICRVDSFFSHGGYCTLSF